MKTSVMKKIVLLFVLVLLSVNLFADNRTKLDFNTHIFLKTYKSKGNSKLKNRLQNYFLQSKNGMKYTKLYIKVNENYSKSAVESLGCKELVKTKSVALISAPVNQIESISNFDFIERIEIATIPKPWLDKALPATNVDKVHQGLNLQQSYFGEGVIVGMVDVGFDFTHPMFSDENGNCRIKRAWIIDSSTNVNPPAGFETGTLYTDSSIIKNTIKYSTIYNNHATHTTGIAAGSPVQGTNAKYSGVATKSDIAIVALETHYTGPPAPIPDDIDMFSNAFLQISTLEAFSYLFKYADSMNKPIVINYSAGFLWNDQQMDGQSLFDIAVSELLNDNPQGKILVASAGNAGSKDIDRSTHFEINLSSADSAVFISNQQNDYNCCFIGEENKNYVIDLYVKNKETLITTKLYTFSTDNPITFPQPTMEDLIDTVLICSTNYNTKDTFELKGTKMAMSNVTNRAYIRFMLDHISDMNDSIIIVVKGDSQTIHFWPAYTAFSSKTNNAIADGNYTVGSPAYLDEVICVGAYTSKYVTNHHSTLNDIAEFSSRGPTISGKIKPDITAPGEELYSAFSSFSEEDINMYNPDNILNSNYYVVEMSGTSMSSPVVTGIVALMLEINPKLTQSEIKDIIRITAINDQWTGNAKENKSNIWGWGKIDAHAIMKQLEFSDVKEEQNFIFNVFPNPVNDIVNIQLDNKTEMPYVINIFDETGKLVHISSLKTEKQIDLSKFATGVYFIELHNGKTKSIQKIIKP